MKRTTLHLEFVTPCFLGGANQKTAEWRAASVRGQLRWWFRAVVGGELSGDLEGTKAAEAEVFGSTAQRSRLAVRAVGPTPQWEARKHCPWKQRRTAQQLADVAGLSSSDEPNLLERLTIETNHGKPISTDPLQYLGYGCIGWDREAGTTVLERACFAPKQQVVLELQWREGAPRGLSRLAGQRLTRALWAWLHLGGIGSRSRNGYGSLAVARIDGELPTGDELSLAPDLDGLRQGSRNLLRIGNHEPEPAWTHLSSRSRIVISKHPFPTWDDALCAAGAWVLTFRRRYGFPGDSRALDGTALADRDYVWAEDAGRGATPGGFPDKAGFGLPLMFDKQGAAVTWLPRSGGETGREDHRRASPLLIHVARLGPSTYHPVLTYLPAQLLPATAQLRFRRRVGRSYQLQPQPRGTAAPSQERVVDLFLDRLKAQGVAQEVNR